MISIPLHIRLVTAEIHGNDARGRNRVMRTVPAGVSSGVARQAAAEVNGIWSAAGIVFGLRDVRAICVNFLENTAQATVADHFLLASQHREASGLTVFIVNQFKNRTRGGMEAHNERGGRLPIATVLRGSRMPLARVIAHELGHVLELTHVTDRENVMYPALLNECRITPDQAQQARTSGFARSLGAQAQAATRTPAWAT